MKPNTVYKLSVVFFIIFSISNFDLQISTGGDNLVYLALKDSLIGGSGFKDIYLASEPLHLRFTPGFPLLLCIPALISKSSLILYKVYVYLLALLTFFMIFLISKKINKKELFFLSTLIPHFYYFSSHIFSEMPFTLSILLSYFYFLKYQEENSSKNILLTFLFALSSLLIRKIGLTLLIAFAIYFTIKREFKKALLFLLPGLIFISSWEYLNHLFTGKSVIFWLTDRPFLNKTAGIDIAGFINRVIINIKNYLLIFLPYLFFPWNSNMFSMVICSLLITGLILFQTIRQKKLTLVNIWLILYFLTLFVWPSNWGTYRFLFPIFFFLLKILYDGYININVHRVKFALKLVFLVFLFMNIIYTLINAFTTTVNNFKIIRGDKYAGILYPWKSYIQLCSWLKENVLEDEIIIARKPVFVYYFGKHKSTPYPFTYDKNEVWAKIKKYKYVLMDNFIWTTKEYLVPVIIEKWDSLEILQAEKGSLLLKIKETFKHQEPEPF